MLSDIFFLPNFFPVASGKMRIHISKMILELKGITVSIHFTLRIYMYI